MSRLNTSQRPYYLMYCIQRWLNLVLQLLVGGIAVVLIALALNLRGTSSANLLGVSLSSIVTFNGTLAMLMMFWTQLETSLGAVARVKGFEASTKAEGEPDETLVPTPDWPSNGSIELRNVSAGYRYGACNLPLLKHLVADDRFKGLAKRRCKMFLSKSYQGRRLGFVAALGGE